MRPCLSIYEIEHFSQNAMARLQKHFDINQPWTSCVDVLWTRFRVPHLESYPRLKLMCANCTDVSHLPLDECERRGIEVLSLKGIEGLDNVHATAEHTISLMLQALRHRADRSSGRIGRELHGKTVAIVGYGRIGQIVDFYLQAFDCCVGWDGTDEVLADSDIVSIHASLNETSRGMVNAEFLSKLKPGCILVNTARHAIVDEEAVIDWLVNDPQAVYAHDFKGECDIGGPQVIETPHIGGWTIESLHKTEELLAEKVIEWSKSRALEAQAVPQ